MFTICSQSCNTHTTGVGYYKDANTIRRKLRNFLCTRKDHRIVRWFFLVQKSIDFYQCVVYYYKVKDFIIRAIRRYNSPPTLR